jgi:hypothetical protein
MVIYVAVCFCFLFGATINNILFVFIVWMQEEHSLDKSIKKNCQLLALVEQVPMEHGALKNLNNRLKTNSLT